MSAEHDDARRHSGAAGASGDESGHALASTLLNEGTSAPGTSSARVDKPDLTEAGQPVPRGSAHADIPPKSPITPADDVLSPDAADRVFPIRSVISVQSIPSTSTPGTARPGQTEGYFLSYASRRSSMNASESSYNSGSAMNRKGSKPNWDRAVERNERNDRNRKTSSSGTTGPQIR